MTGQSVPGAVESLDIGAPAPSRRPDRRAIWAAAALGFAVGTALGLLGDGDRAEPPATPGPSLVATELRQVAQSSTLQVRLHNTGEEEVTVRDLHTGRGGPITAGTSPTLIAPGTWADVDLRAPTECREVPSLRVYALTGSGDGRGLLTLRLPLPPGSLAHVAQFSAGCIDRPGVAPDRLPGVWTVADDYTSTPKQRVLWRFDPDGTFAIEADGRIFMNGEGITGRYRVGERTLTLRVTGGVRAACGARTVDVQVSSLDAFHLLFDFSATAPPNHVDCLVPSADTYVLERLVSLGEASTP